MTDDQQLTELFDRMCQAWTDGDARAYGACFTEDCDYVSYDGYWERGREPMGVSHDKLFRRCWPARPSSERWNRSATSATTSRWSTPPARCWWPGGPACPRVAAPAARSWPCGPPRGWRFTAIHNGRIRPVGVPEPDSFPSRVARGLVQASRALHIGRAPAQV